MKNTKNQIQKFELNDNELEMCSGGFVFFDINIKTGIGIGIGIGISKLAYDVLCQIVTEIHRTIAVKKQKTER